MNISAKIRLLISLDKDMDHVSLEIPKYLMPQFTKLMIRALNTWQDKPPEFTEFLDKLTGIPDSGHHDEHH